MAYEVITLNLIPSGDVPVIHAAQYDKNRPLNFALKLGEDDFNPSGYDLELQIRKVDNNIVIVAPESVNNNVVTFLSTEQMTACSGTNLGEIQITKDALDIATLHFYLVVQRDVLAGGMTSTSDIHNLEEQIEELLPEALGDQYYTKDQTNTLLDGKADVSDIPDMSNYYTKSETYSSGEVNTLLSAKADTSALAAVATSGNYNDLSNKPTIPDAQVNSDWNAESGVAMILNKPTIPAAQVQSDWTQADNTKVDYIKNKPTIPTIETATIQNVAIATFPDGADNVPVKSLKVDIDANLSGVSSVNVVSGGDNLVSSVNTVSAYDVTVSWDSDTNEILITNDGRTTNFSNGATYGVVFNNLISGHTYAYKCSVDGVGLTQTGGDASILPLTFNGSVGSVSVRITKDYDFVREHPIGNVQRVKIALCDLTADNGTTYPISLGGTYYGGTLDVTNGSLTVKYARVDLGLMNWNYDSSTPRFVSEYIKTVIKTTTASELPNVLCADYTPTQIGNIYNPNYDDIIGVSTAGVVSIKDTSYTDATAFTNAVLGKYLTYELATPITVTLTPTQVKTLLGNNNIFADSGNVNEVIYFKTGCESIARLIEAYM